MAKILDMPKLSPTMEEGLLSAWHKKEGDTVGIDDLLAEVETDKATMEFRAFDKGTLLKLLVKPGTQVKLGQPVAILGAPGDDISALMATVNGGSPAAAGPAPGAAPAPSPPAPATAPPALASTPAAAEQPRTESAAPSAALTVARERAMGSPLDRTAREPVVVPAAAGRVLASPYVRKLGRDRGIDLASIRGSGAHGRIEAADLRAAEAPVAAVHQATNAAAASATSTAGAAATPHALAKTSLLAAPEVRALSPMRKTIARRLTESKSTVPHFYLQIDVDAAPLMQFREMLNRELTGDADPKTVPAAPVLKLSVNDILIKAVALALRRVPECNASFTPEAILVHRRVDISVAVAITDGLVTPVLRDADKKSIVAIAEEVRELASRARAKKLKPEEMADGTFSISNLGMFGIDAFAAVINPPEGAILAVGQVRSEPVVLGDTVVAGKRLMLTLSCDHRVVDGAVGAAFLAELRALLTKPMRILTG
jgi:pyruvate dehydrogenase E2 component (dihydrolipoamide acetyltransferase)